MPIAIKSNDQPCLRSTNQSNQSIKHSSQSINQSNQSINPSNQSIKTNLINQSTIHIDHLFRHSFLLPLIVDYLDDADVLLGLLPINSSIKQYLDRYQIKRSVTEHQYRFLTGTARYFTPVITRLEYVTDPKLTSISTLKAVKMDDLKSDITVGMISESVEELYFKYSHPLCEGMLPKHLKVLHMREGNKYQPIKPGILPNELQELVVGDGFGPVKIGSLPSSLTSISWEDENYNGNLSFGAGMFPESLTSLKLHVSFDDSCIEYNSDDDEEQVVPVMFPSKLTDLDVYLDDSHMDGARIPTRVRTLTLGLNGFLDQHAIPPFASVETLTIIGSFERLLPCSSWSSLRHLILITDTPLLELPALPNTLESLEITGTFNQALKPGMLPHSLQKLNLGEDWNHPIDIGVLPSGLTALTLGPNFNCQIAPGVFPPSLRELHWWI